MEDVRAKKRELRKLVRSRLKAMEQSDIASESEGVWDHLFRLPEYRDARSVGLFLSMPQGEIVTDAALARVLEDGKTLYVPRVGLDFEKCDMDLIKVVVSHQQTDEIAHNVAKAHRLFYHDWPRNKWGIPEPPTDIDHEAASPGDIDLLVVPGLAFDRAGGRLGQGKGYYDRFITKMRGDRSREADSNGAGKPLLVAAALEASFLEGEDTVPMSEHDYPMDMLVLPSGPVSISQTKDS
uniref:5-formyltetrahydrofolate cyclo-ligase n=1 Tax=Trieres chinensis TaxID=1514140 RepID=A0A7S1Z7M3_TRICV